MVKVKEYAQKISNFINKFVFVLLPIIVLAIFLLLAKKYNLTPIGKKTIAWCDMEQQVVPLLNDFHDVLIGKKQFTYSSVNAGGMSMWGVFFFFLASPYSLLVAFISKSDMLAFMNVLVMIKMMTISLTMAIYLRKKYKDLNGLYIIGFSILYTFCGYVMMYYQNIIWLDLVAFFPIFLLSIDALIEKGKVWPYVLCCFINVGMNYYLGIIVVFFVILYVGAILFTKRKEEGIKKIAFRFIVGSLSAALISMIILIPSFYDYFKSARGDSIIESLQNSWVTTSYQTTIPLILGTISLIPFFFIKSENPTKKTKLVLLLLLTIPLIIDPINKMWHFGSYQGFPCRFAFINTFLFIDIASMSCLEIKNEKFNIKSIIKYSAGFLVGLGCIIALFVFEQKFSTKKLTDLSKYSTSLWGNTTSLEALLRFYGIVLIVSLVMFALYKAKMYSKRTLGLSFVAFAILDAMFAFKIYASVPSREVTSYKDYYALSGVIEDDSFYRVKTDSKYRNVNDLGGLGYNNLGHYTSLTSKDYMFTMKKLGYSSYWMEVGSYGGTSFTDALLLNKYTIKNSASPSALYTVGNYSIYQNEVYPLGLVTSSDLSKEEELIAGVRPSMQEHIYETLFKDSSSLYTIYDYDSLTGVTDNKPENGFNLSTNGSGKITYNINVVGKQDLYFEVFGKYSSSLVEDVNEAFSVKCNGSTKSYSYPTQSYNGSVYLGTYTDRSVTVEISVKKSVKGSSLSVFGVNKQLLTSSIANAKHADMTYTDGKFKGTYTSSNEGEYLFLPISYNDGIRAKINGKLVNVDKVFSSFVGVKLNQGENKIEIYFTQKGLGLGITISVFGMAILGAFIYLEKMKKLDKIENKIVTTISYYSVEILAIALFLALYIIPLIINVKGQMK